MSCLSGVRWRVPSSAAFLVCGSVVFLGGQTVSAVEPFTYVYDAPATSSVGLSKKRLSKKDGWTRLKENDTTHRFEGCAVLMNDRIVAVLHQDTPDVDIYSRKGQSVKLCARLQPICDGGTDLKRTSLAVEENTPGSVSLKASFRSVDHGVRHVVYEINVGEAFIKATATAGVEKLRVHAPCRFAVMPDFFADDIVIDAAAMRVKKAELPSENFLLHMMHEGDAVLMTVSESRDNDVEIALSETAPREIVSSDISFGAKPHIWIAILAEEGIWHEQTIRAADADRVINLDWKMPFAALWRVDWSTEDKLTDSWEMLLQNPEGKYVMQGWFGRQMSAYLERQKRLHPQHAEFLDELLLLTERLDRSFAENVQRIHTPQYAQQTAQDFGKKLLTYTENDAYEKCNTQMRIFTSIGGAQDGLVASCRMIAKILRQRSGIAMAVNPELKEIATEIRGRTHAVLRNPTAYEAPRH